MKKQFKLTAVLAAVILIVSCAPTPYYYGEPVSTPQQTVHALWKLGLILIGQSRTNRHLDRIETALIIKGINKRVVELVEECSLTVAEGGDALNKETRRRWRGGGGDGHGDVAERRARQAGLAVAGRVRGVVAFPMAENGVFDIEVTGRIDTQADGNWYLRGVGGRRYFGMEGISWQLVAT